MKKLSNTDTEAKLKKSMYFTQAMEDYVTKNQVCKLFALTDGTVTLVQLDQLNSQQYTSFRGSQFYQHNSQQCAPFRGSQLELIIQSFLANLNHQLFQEQPENQFCKMQMLNYSLLHYGPSPTPTPLLTPAARVYQLKTFVMFSRFYLLSGWGGWGLNEFVKKRKFVTKIFGMKF